MQRQRTTEIYCIFICSDLLYPQHIQKKKSCINFYIENYTTKTSQISVEFIFFSGNIVINKCLGFTKIMLLLFLYTLWCALSETPLAQCSFHSHFQKAFFCVSLLIMKVLTELATVYFQNDFQMHCLSARWSENVSNTNDKHILLFCRFQTLSKVIWVLLAKHQ